MITGKKKVISIITIFVMIAALFYTVSDFDSLADTTVKAGVVKSGPLNVRSGAGTGYKSYGTLAKGKSITIKGTATASNGSKWYKITYKSKTGYVHSKYVTIKSTTTTYSTAKKGFVKKAVAVRAKASSSATKYGTLSAGTIATLKGLYTSGSTKWYKITYNSKTAYILASYVTQISYSAYSPTKTGKTTAALNVRSGPSTGFSKYGTLAKGKSITLYAKVKYGGSYWYRVRYNSKYAYVSANYVKITTTSSSSATTTGTMTAAQFETYMTSQGFPASYKPYLRKLHEKHPKWVFKAQKTGLSWDTVLSAQKKLGVNLVSTSTSDAWKTLRSGAYDFTNNKYVVFDGGWNQASNAVIAYYLDPRNGLNENSIYQFMTHGFSSASQNTTTVKSITNSVSYCFMNTKNTSLNYPKLLYNAGKSGKVNPNVLTAMVIMEQGWKGGSGLISGTYSGYKGYYNYFNIGAYHANGMTAVQRGLWWAKGAGTGAKTYGRPWNTRAKALNGGAAFYYQNYVGAKQNTYYLKKFNVMNGFSKITSHQYSTAVFAADNEGKILKKAYSGNDNYAITFYIPVYSNMPSTAYAKPGTTGNNDYYLNSLSVSGYSISPKFSRYTSTYTLTVPNSASSVKINAKAHNSKAAVTGTGTVSLKVGTNNKYVKVKSTSGLTKTYKLVITRK